MAGVQVRVAFNPGILITNVLTMDCWQLWHKKKGLFPKLPTGVLCTFLILLCIHLQGHPEAKKLALPSKWNGGHMKSCLPSHAVGCS